MSKQKFVASNVDLARCATMRGHAAAMIAHLQVPLSWLARGTIIFMLVFQNLKHFMNDHLRKLGMALMI